MDSPLLLNPAQPTVSKMYSCLGKSCQEGTALIRGVIIDRSVGMAQFMDNGK